MKPPPPRPEDCGSTSPSTSSAAIAASTAPPPARSISSAASTACGLAAAAMASPRGASARCSGAVAAQAASASATSGASSRFQVLCLSNIGALPRRARSYMGNRERPAMARPGQTNSLGDVAGLSIGCAEDQAALTGVTVIVPDARAVCAADVRGGGPGTRETDALAPENLVDAVDALVLAGGSVYGLAAADGVVSAMGAENKGFALIDLPGVPRSPVVPAAILYDLANGGDKAWGDNPPHAALGRAAYAARARDVPLGNAGAGLGAVAGALKGGQGSASIVTNDGFTIAALACVNCWGATTLPGQRAFWAHAF